MLSRKLSVHASLVILSVALLSACATAPGESPSSSDAITPTSPAGLPQNIVALVDAKQVTATITGISMDALALHLRNISAQALEVQIPTGTFFVARDPRVQNMVARHGTTATLQPMEARDITIEAACANVRRAEPGSTDTFGIVRASEQPELGQILKTLDSAGVQYPVEQAAIWIVTDDASYDDLGMLVGGSPYGEALIGENEAVRGMMLVSEAGLDITKYAIWGERGTLLPKLTESDLTAWLAKQMAATATGTEASAAESTTGEEGQLISQWATSAEADYQLSSDAGSAMQATGSPNTDGCGDQPTAWASGDANPGAVLTLYYERAVAPTRIVIYETYNPGAIYYVEVRDKYVDRGYEVYQGNATLLSECPRKLVIDVKDVPGVANVVKINVDQSNGWTQIDAVELTGTLP